MGIGVGVLVLANNLIFVVKNFCCKRQNYFFDFALDRSLRSQQTVFDQLLSKR